MLSFYALQLLLQEAPVTPNGSKLARMWFLSRTVLPFAYLFAGLKHLMIGWTAGNCTCSVELRPTSYHGQQRQITSVARELAQA